MFLASIWATKDDIGIKIIFFKSKNSLRKKNITDFIYFVYKCIYPNISKIFVFFILWIQHIKINCYCLILKFYFYNLHKILFQYSVSIEILYNLFLLNCFILNIFLQKAIFLKYPATIRLILDVNIAILKLHLKTNQLL